MEQPTQRVRMKVGNFELEIEGASAYDEFRKFRDEFGSLLSPNSAKLTALTTGPSPVEVGAVEARISSDLPSLPDLAIRNVGGSEREWIALYALYLTDRDTKKTFAAADIWNLYKESGRENHSRQSNLSSNLKRCVEVQWLTKIKEDTYALAPQGREHASQVISRNVSSKETQRKQGTSEQDN